MQNDRLHQVVKTGSQAKVEEILAVPNAKNAIKERDRRGLTPLNYGVIRSDVGIETLQAPNKAGADPRDLGLSALEQDNDLRKQILGLAPKSSRP